MELNKALESKSYFINDIFTDENTRRRLESISVIKGVIIKVIFQHNSGTVIQVGDTRLALDKIVTSNIDVSLIDDDSTLKEVLTSSLKSCDKEECCCENKEIKND